MKQKTKLTKVLAISLCLALILSMFSTYSKASITEDTDTASIIVNGVEAGVKVSAYKLTTVNYDYDADQLTDNPYAWVSEVQTWLQSTHPTYVNMETFAEEVSGEEEAKSFYSELAAAIRGGTVTLTPKEGTAGGTATYPVGDDDLTGSVTLTDCEMGTYIVLIENGYKVYTPSVVNLVPSYNEENSEWELPNQTVMVKSTNPQITKTVTDDSAKADNYSTKDAISFKIVADLPTYLSTSRSKKYYISDDLSDGLELDTSSIKVYGQLGSAPRVELTSPANYTLTTDGATRPNTSATPVDFSINFVYDSITSYDKIIVEYTAKLKKDSNAVVGGTGNTNTAYLDYSNNPYDDTSMQEQNDQSKVYTYGVEVTKTDKSSGSPITGESNAEFQLLQSDTPLYFVSTAAGVYYLANNTDGGATTTLAVDTNGKLYIYGLDTGTYSLKETKAPAEYNLSTTAVPITITDDDKDGALDDEEGTTGIVTLSFQNSKGFQLPTTGGMGTVIFAAGGIVFIGLGIVLLIFAIKRKNK